MAAKWVNSSVLDGGLTAIKTNATKMHLLSIYTLGDSYATVNTNTIASVTMASTDFTLSLSGINRVLTTAAGKSAVATATTGASPDLQIAFSDGSANVLWVTDETSNQVVTSGNTVNFPSVTYTSNQPT